MTLLHDPFSQIPDAEPQLNKVIVSRGTQISPLALEDIANYIEQRGLKTPVSQIVGFQQFSGQGAPRVATSESTTSTTYTDIATVGPQVTGLPDGQYSVIFGATFSNSAGVGTAFVSVKYGSAEAVDADAVSGNHTSPGTGHSTCINVTLNGGGNNTIKLRYRTSSGTASFLERWLFVLRYANA